MNTKKITQTFIIALAMMVTLTIGSSAVFGQNKTNELITILPADEQGNDLTGVWEEVSVPATVDCQTGVPNGPTINALYTFNQGGTMYQEDTIPVDRYRTTGGGIWKRTSGRNYTYVNLHYSFDANGTFLSTVKQRANLTLSRNSDSFTENGTFEITDPSGKVVFSGCYTATATRLRF